MVVCWGYQLPMHCPAAVAPCQHYSSYRLCRYCGVVSSMGQPFSCSAIFSSTTSNGYTQ